MSLANTSEIIEELKSEIEAYFNKIIVQLNSSGKSELAQKLKEHQYAVFYSNPFHTLKNGDVYFLGLNPAGKLDAPQDLFFRTKRTDHLDYLDEDWGRGETHRTRILEALKKAHQFLGVDPSDEKLRKVFATNMYFFGSPDASTLFRYGIDHDFFFKWHTTFLEIVKPKIILCNGNGESRQSPYGSMKRMFNTYNENIKGFYQGFSFKSFEIQIKENKILVIGLPHMSRHLLNNNSIGEGFYEHMKAVIQKSAK